MTRPQTVIGPTRTSPEWCGDSLGPDRLMRAPAFLDVSQFSATDAVKVTVTAPASQGATSVTVAALSGPIPDNTVLDFGGNKFARLNGAAAADATALTVDALVTALAGTEVATYAGAGTEPVTVPGGTPIGRKFAERDAGAGFGPAASDDDELSFLAFSVDDARVNASVEWLRPYAGTLLYENYLPAGWAAADTATKAALRARFNLVTQPEY